ncbi:MAG: ATP-dependent helicase HrpB [Kiritimatiellae bacterium]|nr:ATP-dependent helicase HrpB [Kiritimatiellia bacterium]
MFPVEEKIGDVKRALAANRTAVLTAPPGSGKTTCVPPALLGEPWLKGRKIVMLEPRRLAARSCASYIAAKLGESPGGTVGYQVRLERKVSRETRLEIVTEGLLAQRLLADPELSDTALVIFDEFHERSLACDLAFALALDARRGLREDLRLLVMSATLDADEVAAHLGDAETIRAEGRMFPVETRYLDGMTMPGAIARARKETDGDILCFLPGEGEIRRTMESVPDALPLYGALPKEEQDRVFADTGERKTILATSIAETSLTIPGITTVIDCGLMRIPKFSPSTGMSGLATVPLSMDRAEQRRGRAGRVRAGVCYRLWRESENSARPGKMSPEILDADLASTVLASASWGAPRRTDLPWLTPPPAGSWDQACGLLKLLGALDAGGRLTAKGERLAKMPMHPRLANMLAEGGGAEAALLAAIIEEGVKGGETDIRRVEPPRRVKELAKRFGRFSREGAALSEGALLSLAYPDRIAKGRGNGSFRMVSGRSAFLDRSDPLAKAPFLVCCSLDDRIGDAKLFLACPVSEGEIEELYGDRMAEESFCAWDRRTDRVASSLRRKLGEMTVSEKASPGDAEGVLEAMLEGIRIKGVKNMPCWTKESLRLKSRIAFLSRAMGENGGSPWPGMDDGSILSALPGFIGGMAKWKDLERLDLFGVMDSMLAESGHDRRELDRLAPQRMELPSGSCMAIHYEGDEPTVEARLQECFGMMATPKVAGGRIPVVMTLLSPAQRPVQVTKDLAGFWKEGYPLVRKDMRGRYPKHYWPEDPFTATATSRVRPREA